MRFLIICLWCIHGVDAVKNSDLHVNGKDTVAGRPTQDRKTPVGEPVVSKEPIVSKEPAVATEHSSPEHHHKHHKHYHQRHKQHSKLAQSLINLFAKSGNALSDGWKFVLGEKEEHHKEREQKSNKIGKARLGSKTTGRHGAAQTLPNEKEFSALEKFSKKVSRRKRKRTRVPPKCKNVFASNVNIKHSNKDDQHDSYLRYSRFLNSGTVYSTENQNQSNEYEQDKLFASMLQLGKRYEDLQKMQNKVKTEASRMQKKILSVSISKGSTVLELQRKPSNGEPATGDNKLESGGSSESESKNSNQADHEKLSKLRSLEKRQAAASSLLMKGIRGIAALLDCELNPTVELKKENERPSLLLQRSNPGCSYESSEANGLSLLETKHTEYESSRINEFFGKDSDDLEKLLLDAWKEQTKNHVKDTPLAIKVPIFTSLQQGESFMEMDKSGKTVRTGKPTAKTQSEGDYILSTKNADLLQQMRQRFIDRPSEVAAISASSWNSDRTWNALLSADSDSSKVAEDQQPSSVLEGVGAQVTVIQGTVKQANPPSRSGKRFRRLATDLSFYDFCSGKASMGDAPNVNTGLPPSMMIDTRTDLYTRTIQYLHKLGNHLKSPTAKEAIHAPFSLKGSHAKTYKYFEHLRHNSWKLPSEIEKHGVDYCKNAARCGSEKDMTNCVNKSWPQIVDSFISLVFVPQTDQCVKVCGDKTEIELMRLLSEQDLKNESMCHQLCGSIFSESETCKALQRYMLLERGQGDKKAFERSKSGEFIFFEETEKAILLVSEAVHSAIKCKDDPFSDQEDRFLSDFRRYNHWQLGGECAKCNTMVPNFMQNLDLGEGYPDVENPDLTRMYPWYKASPEAGPTPSGADPEGSTGTEDSQDGDSNEGGAGDGAPGDASEDRSSWLQKSGGEPTTRVESHSSNPADGERKRKPFHPVIRDNDSGKHDAFSLQEDERHEYPQVQTRCTPWNFVAKVETLRRMKSDFLGAVFLYSPARVEEIIMTSISRKAEQFYRGIEAKGDEHALHSGESVDVDAHVKNHAHGLFKTIIDLYGQRNRDALFSFYLEHPSELWHEDVWVNITPTKLRIEMRLKEIAQEFCDTFLIPSKNYCVEFYNLKPCSPLTCNRESLLSLAGFLGTENGIAQDTNLAVSSNSDYSLWSVFDEVHRLAGRTRKEIDQNLQEMQDLCARKSVASHPEKLQDSRNKSMQLRDEAFEEVERALHGVIPDLYDNEITPRINSLLALERQQKLLSGELALSKHQKHRHALERRVRVLSEDITAHEKNILNMNRIYERGLIRAREEIVRLLAVDQEQRKTIATMDVSNGCGSSGDSLDVGKHAPEDANETDQLTAQHNVTFATNEGKSGAEKDSRVEILKSFLRETILKAEPTVVGIGRKLEAATAAAVPRVVNATIFSKDWVVATTKHSRQWIGAAKDSIVAADHSLLKHLNGIHGLNRKSLIVGLYVCLAALTCMMGISYVHSWLWRGKRAKPEASDVPMERQDNLKEPMLSTRKAELELGSAISKKKKMIPIEKRSTKDTPRGGTSQYATSRNSESKDATCSDAVSKTITSKDYTSREQSTQGNDDGFHLQSKLIANEESRSPSKSCDDEESSSDISNTPENSGATSSSENVPATLNLQKDGIFRSTTDFQKAFRCRTLVEAALLKRFYALNDEEAEEGELVAHELTLVRESKREVLINWDLGLGLKTGSADQLAQKWLKDGTLSNKHNGVFETERLNFQDNDMADQSQKDRRQILVKFDESSLCEMLVERDRFLDVLHSIAQDENVDDMENVRETARESVIAKLQQLDLLIRQKAIRGDEDDALAEHICIGNISSSTVKYVIKRNSILSKIFSIENVSSSEAIRSPSDAGEGFEEEDSVLSDVEVAQPDGTSYSRNSDSRS